MTDEELLAEVRRHWEHWAGHLGLENWRVFYKIDNKLQAKNVLMQTMLSEKYMRLTLAICAKAFEKTPERLTELSQDTLHEVLHVPLDVLDTVAWAAGTDWQHSYRNKEEAVIDLLVSAFHRLHEQTDCGKATRADESNGTYSDPLAFKSLSSLLGTPMDATERVGATWQAFYQDKWDGP